MQVPVAEQAVHSLDVMLDPRAARPVAPELCQRSLATENEGLHDADERVSAHGVPDDEPLSEPP